MAEEVAMRGVPAVTVARVIVRARVSRRLFYELFADIEDCFLATFDWGVEQARALAVDAYTAEEGWREGVRAGLAAILRLLDERPLLAQLCVVHAAGGGPRVLERRSLVIAELCEIVDRGRAVNSGPAAALRTPAPVMAEGVVGAVMAVLYARLRAQGDVAADGAAQTRPLIDLHGELMSLIVLPYLGNKLAGNELRRAVPASRPKLAPIAPELEQGLPSERSGSRLTYRTVRVLMSIAELPGPSNREVAERVGIVDQGQISKLLTRLEYQGLIVNRGADSPARGTPNAWWLTEHGEALERDLRERPPSQGPPRERKGTGARG